MATTKKTAKKTTASKVLAEVEFEFERETKNKVRFAEVGDGDVIGTLYVSKSAFSNGKFPETLTVTIN